MKTASYFNECTECGAEMDTKLEECFKCGCDELLLIDERKLCPLCKEKKEEDSVVNNCERCGKEVCDDCVYESYPYNNTLCGECGEQWYDLMVEYGFPC